MIALSSVWHIGISRRFDHHTKDHVIKSGVAGLRRWILMRQMVIFVLQLFAIYFAVKRMPSNLRFKTAFALLNSLRKDRMGL